MIYAGIGSRSTPPLILAQMQDIGRAMAREGWLLRSGGADGADYAFEAGCDVVQGKKEIWLPWKGFNGSDSQFILPERGTPERIRAEAIAASIHPAWDRCNGWVQRLHARNVLQVLGADFNTPVDRVICWTPNGDLVGGTRTVLVLAQQYGIEIINMGSPNYLEGDINGKEQSDR